MKIDPQDKKRRLLTNVHGLRRQLYMSANVADAPLRIPCGSAKQAQKLRFGLYASARVVKQNPDVDPEFLAAAENVIATVEGEVVVLTRSELTAEGMAATRALLALGITPESGGVHSIAARVAGERAMKEPMRTEMKKQMYKELYSGTNGTTAGDLPGHEVARRVEAMQALCEGGNGTTPGDFMSATALKEAHFSAMPEFPSIRGHEPDEATPANPYPRRNTLNF